MHRIVDNRRSVSIHLERRYFFLPVSSFPLGQRIFRSREPVGSREVKVLYLFEDFALDTKRRELRRGSATVPVEPQVFDLLHYLIRHRDHVVSRVVLALALSHLPAGARELPRSGGAMPFANQLSDPGYLPVWFLLRADQPGQPAGGGEAGGGELPLRLVPIRRGLRAAKPLSGRAS